MGKIDLHIHTTISDGTDTPAQVVERALRHGLSAIAITDHDAIGGYQAAAAAAEGTSLEVVPGIEISTKYNRAVHILGYFIDINSPSLNARLKAIVDDRDIRADKVIELMKNDGIDVSRELMHEKYGEVIGRPNFAELLVEKGLAKDVPDAFARFMERGQRYFVPRTIVPIEESIQIIRSAGGVPVLAHPYQYKLDDAGLRGLIELCIANGLLGMECRYSGYDAGMGKYLSRLADEYGLVKTGGSDFHGSNKPLIHLGDGIDRNLSVPYSYLENLKTVHKKITAAV